jgi:hypothetical protein
MGANLMRPVNSRVMAGPRAGPPVRLGDLLVPAIHNLTRLSTPIVDGRAKAGHDTMATLQPRAPLCSRLRACTG